MTYLEALREALNSTLMDNPHALLIGEDVGEYQGAYSVSKGLLEKYGPNKIMDAPLSEASFTGIGIGLALGGMIPIIEIMTVNFSLLALDQIVNSASSYKLMSGGEFSLPLVIRMSTGGGKQLGAQHSHSLEGWFSHIPGLKIFVPSSVSDARYFLPYAIKCHDPILIFEHSLLLSKIEDLSSVHPFFSAQVRKTGNRLTVLSYGYMLDQCLEAAQELDQVEVIDLRFLRPLDDETIFLSVRKTHRVLIVDEGWKSCSLSSEVMARIMENCFFDLDRPLERLCRKEIHLPYVINLEKVIIPQVSDIHNKMKEMLK